MPEQKILKAPLVLLVQMAAGVFLEKDLVVDKGSPVRGNGEEFARYGLATRRICSCGRSSGTRTPSRGCSIIHITAAVTPMATCTVVATSRLSSSILSTLLVSTTPRGVAAYRREAAGSSPQVLEKSSGLVLLKGICRDARKRRQGEKLSAAARNQDGWRPPACRRGSAALQWLHYTTKG